MTLHVYASLVPKPEHADDVAAALRPLIAASRAEPGNRRYDLFGPADGTPGFHLIEAYTDHDALEAHRRSAHYLAYRAAAATWLAEPPRVTVLVALDAVTR